MNKINTLVISSGGKRTIVSVGIINELYKQDYLNNINVYIGTSGGSLLVLLLAIGYTGDEISRMICELNLIGILCKDLMLNNILNMPTKLGLIDSNKSFKTTLLKIISSSRVLKGNGDITFIQYYNITGKSIIICATDLKLSKPIYFNYITTPNVSLEFAIRSSCAIPFLFSPVSGRYVDGALIDHYPISQATCNVDEFIGIRIDDIYNSCTDGVNATSLYPQFKKITMYINSIIRCVEKSQCSENPYKKNTIIIPYSRDTCTGDINVCIIKKKMLLKGMTIAKSFIKKNKMNISKSNNILSKLSKSSIMKISQTLLHKRIIYNNVRFK